MENVNGNYQEEAQEFINAIITLASKERNLQNLECYLSYHFKSWLDKFASTPEGMAAELTLFA